MKCSLPCRRALFYFKRLLHATDGSSPYRMSARWVLSQQFPALQVSIRKKLEDAKGERDRSQANEDIRGLRDEIAELRLAARHGCS